MDGRSLAELLAFAARYGRLIRFYDLADMPSGHWEPFFAGDPAVAAAVRCALDLPEIERSLRALLADARRQIDEETHQLNVERIQRVVMRLLIITSGDAGHGEAFDEHLWAITLKDRRHPLAGQVANLHRHRQNRGDHRQWKLRDLELLEDLAAQALIAVEAGEQEAAAQMAAELQQRGHAPQAAVWNAFVQLYMQARSAMNMFPARMLDFYYRDVLRQSHCDAVPARTFLTVALNKDASGASIPKGTRFQAGTDVNGDPIIYVASHSLDVVPATVTRISVHRSVGGEDDRTGILSGTVAANGLPFPAFGSNSEEPTGALTMRQAGLGFVIASPMLLLEGGARTVKITLASAPQVTRPKTMLRAHVPPAIAAAQVATAESPGPQLPDPPTNLWFVLSYSTAGGWVTVEGVQFTTCEHNAAGEQTLEFSFDLPPDAPPLVALATKPAPGAGKPDLPPDSFPGLGDEPTVVAQLLQEPRGPMGSATAGAPVLRSNYDVLRKIKVKTVTIDVTVDGLVPARMASSGGAIDASQNFAVFGLAPAKGSMLKLSATEIFAKVPSRLSVRIDWAKLPTGPTGFAGWYADYTLDADGKPASGLFNNASFRVSMGPAQPGLWNLPPPPVEATGQPAAAEAPSHFLFQSGGSSTAADGNGPPAAGQLDPFSVLALPSAEPAPKPPLYFNPAANALVLTLTAPDAAFGDTLYARNLISASLANSNLIQASGSSLSGAIQAANAANSAAPATSYAATMQPAVATAVSTLGGHALAQLKAGIAASSADPDTQARAHAALSELTAPAKPPGLIGRLFAWLRRKPLQAAETAIVSNLHDWAESWHDLLAGNGSNAAFMAGKSLLTTARSLMERWESAASQPTPVARAQTAAALQDSLNGVRATPSPVILPNPPWLPMGSAVTISYAAVATYQAIAGQIVDAPASSSQAPRPEPVTDAAQVMNPAASGTPHPALGDFAHLDVFGKLAPVRPPPPHHPVQQAPLLQDPEGEAALYIDLSQPVDSVALLFVVEAGPEGWSTGTDTLRWEKLTADGWQEAFVMQDTSSGLRNTGIVILQIGTAEHDHQDTSARIRAVLPDGGRNNAYISSITTNALAVEWLPGAGADTLGVPMPPGTIKQSEQPIPGIAGIVQPVSGFGGVPPATGAAFQMWMAERLRHKGRPIAGDDHARLIMAALPALWQLAVVPATRDRRGTRAPGHVWLVPVAGPTTPNISDPTVPEVDPITLQEIEEMVGALASPFASVTVSNPPWRRIKVKASLQFSDADTVGACITRLDDELKRWLSPWPDPTLPPRDQTYWTRAAIAEFVRNRPYVTGIDKIELLYDPLHDDHGWYYYTSATSHVLEAATALQGQLQPNREGAA